MDGMKHTLSRFADGTKIGQVLDIPSGLTAVQRDVEKLGVWVLLKLSKEKSQILPLGRKKLWALTHAGWGVFGWKAALQKRLQGSWWTGNGKSTSTLDAKVASSICAALGRASPAS